MQKHDDDVRAQLVESLQCYEELYDLAPVSFLTLDRRATIVGLNKAAGRLLGFPTEWLRERPFLVFVSRRDVSRFLNLLNRVRHLRDHYETMDIQLSIGGQPVPVQVSIKASMRDGSIVYRMAVVDLTESKRVESELRETLSNWNCLVQNAADLILTVDRKGKITFMNRDAWGYSKSGVIGTLLADYVSEADRGNLRKCIASAFASTKPASCEILRMDGEEEHCYSFSFGPVRIPATATTTAASTTTVTIRDITHHRRLEESLRESREQLRDFAARLEQVREEERTRVAREIHDELGQALTIFKMDLAWLQGKTNGADVARKKIKSMIQHVDQTIEHVRKIVSELRPSILDDMGLTAALEWQVAQFQKRTGIRSNLESSSEDFNLPRDTAAALFRVVQEALTNVMRHAGARHVQVALKPGADVLRIAITDDGRGLTRERINDQKSFGIIGMTERVHRIGGEFNIFSGPGKGTRLEIAVPIK